MKAILGHIINMLPYMIITLPIYMLVRFEILKRNTKNWCHEVCLLFFVLFLVGLASQAMIPRIEFDMTGFHIVNTGVHKNNFIPFRFLAETYDEVFVKRNLNYFLVIFLGNIVMFMPLGFFVPLLWKISNRFVILLGFSFSLLIETSQLFLNRQTDVDDLMLNTVGVILGLLLYKLLNRKNKYFIRKFRVD